MNSKQALEDIGSIIYFESNDSTIPLKDTNQFKDKYQAIMKDLELLELLKASIYNCEIHTYQLNEKYKGQKFIMLNSHVRGEENIAKIKVWLNK